MNILKESLFTSSSTTTTRTKPKKTRQHPSRSTTDSDSLAEPLLSPSSENENGQSMELGLIDSDDDNNNINGSSDQKRPLTRPALRSRQAKTNAMPAAQAGGSIVIVEKPVRPNETLQAFAIRYRVPVSQLKRLNNLQNDQDFYALTYCRVPVRRFGVLHESSSPSTIVNLNDQLATSNTIPVTHLTQQNHHAFLNAMDHDLALMRTKVEQLIETPTATLIPQPVNTRMIIRSSTKSKSELNCDGADCGCKLWHIILTIALVALFVPLVYIYLYLTSPEEFSDHHPK